MANNTGNIRTFFGMILNKSMTLLITTNFSLSFAPFTSFLFHLLVPYVIEYVKNTNNNGVYIESFVLYEETFFFVIGNCLLFMTWLTSICCLLFQFRAFLFFLFFLLSTFAKMMLLISHILFCLVQFTILYSKIK